jgi:hypothetical protein
MSSNATLRWASVIGTLLLALLSSVVVATAPRPAGAPLRPAVKPLAPDASIQSKSYVS